MKKASNGFTLVELLVVIGILGILMGALFPAISSAMLSANTNAMAMRGRNLFIAITQRNTEREANGLASVWPQTQTDGLDSDEQKVIGATTSTDYFKYLFDIENKGNATQWNPEVQADIGLISGSGVPGMSGTTLTKNNVAWMVLQNIQSEMDDIIPVFVSRNVAVSELDSKVGSKVESTDTTQVKCGKAGGSEWDTPFGNKAWVLISKGGASRVIKARDSKINVIFNRQGFDNSQLTDKPKFLPL